MRSWWNDLAVAPSPMSRREAMIVTIASIIAASSRFLAISLTPWDWDEGQFMSALRHYDVTAHSPHPPGFPLFIGIAKLLMLAGLSSFRALQTIDVIAAMAIVPAMFFLAREARAAFSVALTAALFLAFFPNVWFYGGTAFSDVPAMVLVIVACALLLRGARSDAAFIGGAIALGLSAAIRPQNLVIGAVPFLIAAVRRRSMGAIVTGGLAVIAMTVLAYGVAAHLSGGWPAYRETLQAHQQYITQTDSFRNPNRPPLHRLIDDFFFWPYRALPINIAVALLMMIGLAMRRPASLAIFCAFAPFCLFAWLFLDHFSASRFSIGYAPLIALLAAEGAFAFRTRAGIAISAIVAGMMIVWTLPPLTTVRTSESPSFAAMRTIRARFPPQQTIVDVDGPMVAFADAMLPDYEWRTIADAVPIATFGDARAVVFAREGISIDPAAMRFQRTPGHLWWLARQRYFDVSVTPVARPQFGTGWYDEESDHGQMWRWMSRRATIVLPPSIRRGRVTLALHAATDASVITISLNGRVLERFDAKSADVERTYDVALRPSQPSELTIETDRTTNAPADPRDLGLRLDRFDLQLEVEPERHPGFHPLAVLRGR